MARRAYIRCMIAVTLPNTSACINAIRHFDNSSFFKIYIAYIFIHQEKKLIASIQQQVNQKSRTKSIKKLRDIVTIIHKAQSCPHGIFNIKPFNTTWPQLTWQVKTEVRLTISYNLCVTCSEHLHKKNLLTTKSKELSSDLTREHLPLKQKMLLFVQYADEHLLIVLHDLSHYCLT